MLIDWTPGPECGPDCAGWLDRWAVWWKERVRDRKPLAMLPCGPGYYASLGRKSRAMVRQAHRNYEYRPYEHNERLDEMGAINFSKAERQGRPMRGWYTEPVPPHDPPSLCPRHRDTWHGCFRREDDVLVGFARLETFDDVGILNSILGHGGQVGVMNGMFAYLNDTAEVRLINYLRMSSATHALSAFKERVGFLQWNPVTEEFYG